MRGRSYTPSPPRDYGRRGRSPPRGGRYRGGDAPTSILVRNLRHDCRPEDLRRPFGQFGPLKDVYLPRDYYTGEPRGFGFVQFVEPADAAEAKYQMDGQIFQGRELTVVFAEENRKKPAEMRSRGGRGSSRYDRRRSPPHRRSRSPVYSRSPPPRYERSRGRDYPSPPPKRRYSRSVSPRERSYDSRQKQRSYSPRSPVARSRSPPQPYDDGRHGGERSPPPYGSRSPRQSPVRGRRSPSRGRSGSPYPEEDYPTTRGGGAAGRDHKRSPSYD